MKFLSSAIGILLLAISLCPGADDWEALDYIPLDSAAIRYNARPANDPAALLDKKLENGKARLDFDSNGLGYLPSLLNRLGIDVDSQVLVFSRTSIQRSHISPSTPRAIYFSDDVAVGYVQGGEVIELSGVDPQQGVFMYTLDNLKAGAPRIGREDDCLRCHQGQATLAVPGLMVSSVHPANEGAGEGHGTAYITDHRTAFKDRWGGWYVTGTAGSQAHLGNNPGLADPLNPTSAAGERAQNVKSLESFFDTSKYLAPTSDVVALMTLEHQVRMTNLITRIGWDARMALGKGMTPHAVLKRMEPELEGMIAYMLFVDEPPLDGIAASGSAFAKTFSKRGPRDGQGRSLRDFDLRTRLFRYPLSYMIYSKAFDGLPAIVLQQIYRRLFDILTSKDQDAKFARISRDDGAAILAILKATKPNLPPYWHSAQRRGRG